MSVYDIVSMLIERKTGRIYDGRKLWDEIITTVNELDHEDGEYWITGFEDDQEKRDYFVRTKKGYDEECEIGYRDISLRAAKIKDKKRHKVWRIKTADVDI